MKKYKIIKSFPGSSSLGTTFNTGGFAGDASKYPEFFEEVIEKDYEILSFTQDSGISDLWVEFEIGWCRSYNGKPITVPYTIEEILSNKLFSIASVKRLSDGEVFTLGDTIKTHKFGYINTLDSIRIINENNSLKTGIWFNYEGGSQHFSNTIKVIKKDYEVYQVLYATEVRTLNDGLYRIFTDGVGFDLDYILKNGGKIQSVKRLSDGEKFSINDMINIGKDHQIMIRTISSINIDINGNLSINTGSGTLTNNKLVGIFNRIKRVPFYEVMSYVHKGRPNCITTKKRGGQRHDEFWNIHSIKRLSDGEIFTIGDQVQFTELCSGKILGIKTTEKNSGRLCFSNDNPTIGGWFNVNDIKKIKIKPVLYRTEDGVEIREKDVYHYIFNGKINNSTGNCNSGKANTFVKYFSTKEAAEAYQLRYEPCLSLDDIQRAINLPPMYWEAILAAAKSKLYEQDKPN